MNRTRIPAVFLGIALIGSGAIGSSAIAQTVSPNRPIKDFIGISFTCRIPMVLVVNPSSSARIVRDLVDLAKSKGGRVELLLVRQRFDPTVHLKTTSMRRSTCSMRRRRPIQTSRFRVTPKR